MSEKKSITFQDPIFATNHPPAYGQNTRINSYVLRNRLSSKENCVIEGSVPVIKPSHINGQNTTINSNVLQHQLSSNGNFPLPLANQLPVNRQTTAINSNGLQHQLFSNGNFGIQNFRRQTNQTLGNGIHVTQHTNLYYCQPPSNRTRMIPKIQPVTSELSTKEINVLQQPYSLAHQRPANFTGTNQDSNMLIQQYFQRASNMSSIGLSGTCELYQNEPRGNLEKGPPTYQKCEREFTMDQDLHPILQSKDILDMLQNPDMPIHEISGLPYSYPSTNDFLRGLFNLNKKVPSVYRYLSLSDINLNQNLYPQYSEKVHICVVGLPECEKEKLVRTFVRDDSIRISQDRPLQFVVQEEMVSFGTTLKIDIWSAEDPILAIQDLRSLCESSKTVILLVYKANQIHTVLIVEEWIKLLKHHLGIKAPIILVANKNGVEMRFPPKVIADIGMRVKKDNDLADFFQCSTECVREVEEVFLIAALKTFHQKIETTVSETSS